MRRAGAGLVVLVLVLGSCGRAELSGGLAATLQDQVAKVRDLAEEGRPGLARNELNELIEMVEARFDQGLIDEGRAIEILEAAEAVLAELALVRRSSPSETSPSPSEEEDGGGNGNGKGKGNGDQGHGNDD